MADWFRFKGINSTSLGVHVLTFPPTTLAEERVEFVDIPGRSGSLAVTQGEDVFEDITLEIECYITDMSALNTISAWLRGGGELILGNSPGFSYRARAINQIEIEKIVRGRTSRIFSAVFRCEPYRYLYPEQMFTYTSTGNIIHNPSTYSSEPIITVYGSGEVSLVVGAVVAVIKDVNGSIVLDSDAGLAYSPGTTMILRTASVDIPGGHWPTLAPGNSAITWSGSVSKIEVKPRWRWR